MFLVTYFVFLVSGPAEAQMRCEGIFAEETLTSVKRHQFPLKALFKLNEKDFLNEIREILTPPSALHDIIEGPQKAQQDVEALESMMHMKLPSDQREKSLKLALRVRTSDNYLMVVNGPPSAHLDRGWSMDAYEIAEQPDHAFYGKVLKMPLVELWYDKAIGPQSHLAKVTVDQDYVYSIYVGRAPREWTNYESTGSTVRILRRENANPTIIERYADENQIPIETFRKKIQQAAKSGSPVFELGRISNTTQNKEVMYVNRLLMAYYLVRANPKSLFVLSTSSLKLVNYYQKWGFTWIDTMKKDESSQAFYLMSASAEEFLNALAFP